MKRKYSWRFKLANFIMGGNLRMYLVFGIMSHIALIQSIDAETKNEKRMQYLVGKIDKCVDEIMY